MKPAGSISVSLVVVIKLDELARNLGSRHFLALSRAVRQQVERLQCWKLSQTENLSVSVIRHHLPSTTVYYLIAMILCVSWYTPSGKQIKCHVRLYQPQATDLYGIVQLYQPQATDLYGIVNISCGTTAVIDLSVCQVVHSVRQVTKVLVLKVNSRLLVVPTNETFLQSGWTLACIKNKKKAYCFVLKLTY